MDKKLGRLLRPRMELFFLMLILFTLGAVAARAYLLALLEGLLTAELGIVYLLRQRRRRRELQSYLSAALSEVSDTRGVESPFPSVAFRLEDNMVIFVNDAFAAITHFSPGLSDKPMDEVLPGMRVDWLAAGKRECPQDVPLGNRRYRVYGTTVRANDPDATLLGVLYFTDLTELYQVRDEYIRSRPVVSIILVDNYEELTKNMTESAMSSLNARINETITAWAEGYHGLLRRLEKNRFLFVFEKRDMLLAAQNKFSLLEDIHKITNRSGLAASVSMGLGVDGATFEECFDFASLSIEMALSRGGDQAVVKDRLNFTFYGGRTKEADHRSKVRSRVTANSLMELIGQSSKVFIMGHRNADMDAVGAAAGINCMCRKMGKKAYIVVDLEHNAAGRLLDELRQVPEYKDVFISGQEAMVQADSRSTLVVVDTNRPDQVEHKPLLEAVPRVCVVDHHRRAADYINPVVVNFHEPYASSASELATELLEYAAEKTDILPVEAKSLLSGIFLDTKSFHVRTGERTFEAAAFLRQLGADPVEVKKLLQNDFQETMAKYQIIRSARMYRQEIAIAALNTGTTRVLAAQAADELLNISGISASFVLYPDENQVIISARSIGRANMQMILEPLGGGGNAATAGAQMKNVTVKEALDRLVASIDQYYDS